jgi:hypothetical protein
LADPFNEGLQRSEFFRKQESKSICEHFLAGDGRRNGWISAKSILGRVADDVAYRLDANQAFSWNEVESNVPRVANGIKHRIHRLKAIGNGQVPLQAAVAWKLLGGE